MQGAGLAVRTHAAIVVNTIGYVGVLLHLGHDDALADRVQCARRDEEAIALMHGHGVQNFRQGVILDALREFLLGNFMVKAVVEERPRLTVQHVPHLGLAILVLVFQRVVVGGMHLNRQIVLRIDEFCQDWELLKLCTIRAKAAGMRGNIVRQR